MLMPMLVDYLNVHVQAAMQYVQVYISVQCTTFVASQPEP